MEGRLYSVESLIKDTIACQMFTVWSKNKSRVQTSFASKGSHAYKRINKKILSHAKTHSEVNIFSSKKAKNDSSFDGSASRNDSMDRKDSSDSVDQKYVQMPRRNKKLGGTMSDANQSIDKTRRKRRMFLSGYRVTENSNMSQCYSDNGYDDEDDISENDLSSGSDYLNKIDDI